jgi:ribonuclease HI
MITEVTSFVLLTETYPEPGENIGGQWRFVLQQTDGKNRLEVSDSEPGICGERLQLLAVVRGLEAIDGMAHVTLVTSSRYVVHGIRFGLEQWREDEWQWERFGEMTQISNCDLWRRIDRALSFHTVECRVWRLKAEPNVQSRAVPVVARDIADAPTSRISKWAQLPSALVRGVGRMLPRAAMAATL